MQRTVLYAKSESCLRGDLPLFKAQCFTIGSFYKRITLWLLKTWERYQGWSNMTLYLSNLAQGDSVQYIQHESALYSDIWRTKLQCWDSCDTKLPLGACHNTATNSKMSSCYARLIMLFLNYISIKRYSDILALYLARCHPSLFLSIH